MKLVKLSFLFILIGIVVGCNKEDWYQGTILGTYENGPYTGIIIAIENNSSIGVPYEFPQKSESTLTLHEGFIRGHFQKVIQVPCTTNKMAGDNIRFQCREYNSEKDDKDIFRIPGTTFWPMIYAELEVPSYILIETE